jgi:hypothetical protein
MNWAGKPLRSFESMRNYIAGTTTRNGLRVEAVLKRSGNEIGERVCDAQMRRLRLDPNPICPQWNYTLRPRPIRARVTA